jgi:hypothetical protein
VILDVITFLTANSIALGALGATITFIWPVYQFFSNKRREAEHRQFEVFHRLIKELVEPPGPNQPLYIDRQAAIIFELRFFPRYSEFTLRTLRTFRKKISLGDHDKEPFLERLTNEIDLTVAHIEYQSMGSLRRLAARRPSS